MSWKRVSLPVGVPFGNLEGIRFLGLLEKQRTLYLGSFLGPRDIKILILGAIWTFGKGTGLSGAHIRLWGTKGPSIRPR